MLLELPVPLTNGPALKEFKIKSRDLCVPTDPGQNGGRPNPAGNILTFNPTYDTNVRYIVYSIELSFDAMSPYILIHGKGCDSRYWDGTNGFGVNCWKGMTETFKNSGIPYDNSITLNHTNDSSMSMELNADYLKAMSQGSIDDQGAQIENQLPQVVNEFGTKHFNLVAHSKGGLDSRWWLTERKDVLASLSHDLILGQFLTMNSVHCGSVIADYAYQSAQLTSDAIPAFLIESTFLKYPFLMLSGLINKAAAGSPATLTIA